jgi:hypothetical protein
LGTRDPAVVSEHYTPTLRLAVWDALVCGEHRGAQTS